MKLFATSYALIVLVLTLLVFKENVVAFPTKFSYKASDQDGEWIRACSDACRDFRAHFQKFTNNVNTDNWNEAHKAFTTCQWRCYRCSLSTGVIGMEAIEAVSSNFADSHSLNTIKAYRREINLSGFICKDKWIEASSLGCTTDPVESVNTTCRS